MSNVVWSPLPGSQSMAIACPGDEILYEGTRGPGKTDTQLMRFRMRVGLGYGQFWRGVIFDRTYKNLADIVAKSLRWFPQFNDGARFTSGGGGYKWVWPTGEELAFRHIRTSKDYWIYHGQEFPFIGWNELCKYPTSEVYDMMMSCNRSSYLPLDFPMYDDDGQVYYLPEIPLEVFSTTNPFGAGHGWLKKKFIDVAPAGVVLRKTTNVFNPRTQQREDITRHQVRIFGSYKENRFLSPQYVAQLEAIKDPNMREAWLYGNWDISAGGAFDGVWSDKLKVPRFKVPRSWYVDRSFDWGSSHPFSVGWWAEASGEEATLPNGKKWAPPRGTLIRIAEWYGTRGVGTNEGLRLGSTSIARGILEREADLIAEGWVQGVIHAGPADNQIGNEIDNEEDSIKLKMERADVHWEESNKSPGSRKIGLQLIRDRMEASNKGEGPGIYWMENCRDSLEILPTLPRDEDDPDDVDTAAEDHIYDETRYRVLKSSGGRVTVNPL